jgi:hypothetical protein
VKVEIGSGSGGFWGTVVHQSVQRWDYLTSVLDGVLCGNWTHATTYDLRGTMFKAVVKSMDTVRKRSHGYVMVCVTIRRDTRGSVNTEWTVIDAAQSAARSKSDDRTAPDCRGLGYQIRKWADDAYGHGNQPPEPEPAGNFGSDEREPV